MELGYISKDIGNKEKAMIHQVMQEQEIRQDMIKVIVKVIEVRSIMIRIEIVSYYSYLEQDMIDIYVHVSEGSQDMIYLGKLEQDEIYSSYLEQHTIYMSKLEMDINDVFAKYKLCKKDPANLAS